MDKLRLISVTSGLIVEISDKPLVRISCPFLVSIAADSDKASCCLRSVQSDSVCLRLHTTTRFESERLLRFLICDQRGSE
jgi:hypothetical protein